MGHAEAMKVHFQEGIWQLRTLALVLIGTVALVFAVLALRGHDSGQPAIVLTADAEPGTLLTDASLQHVILPPQAVPADAVTDLDSTQDASLLRFMTAGEVVTEHSLSGSTRSRAIPSHKSVIQLNIPAVVAHGLTTGDNIDLWGVPTSCPEEACQPQALARGVQVEYVGASTDNGWSEQDQVSVAFLLDSTAVAKVLSADAGGTIHLALRPPTN